MTGKTRSIALMAGFLCLVALVGISPRAYGADSYKSLENLPPAFAPGKRVLLPNGDAVVITEILPDGNFRADGGYVFTPGGVILEGEGRGLSVSLDPAETLSNAEVNLNSPIDINVPGQTPAIAPVVPGGVPGAYYPDARVETPQGDSPVAPWRKIEPKAAQEPGNVPNWRQTPPKTPAVAEKPIVPGKGKPDEALAPEKGLSVAEMLPKTKTPDKIAPHPEGKTPPERAKAEGKKGGENAKRPPEDGKNKDGKKGRGEEKPGKKPQKYDKPKPGQPMRIPPEAIKNGDLSFMEGCWEGTRPEYFSKRTIKECFCFNAGGQSGKRWVKDISQGRQCIGASRANLSQAGVLSVRSDGAACSDGERWGRADMVCRNSGQHTPCSWVFGDAGNGSQSYQIPFVRVESCRR